MQKVIPAFSLTEENNIEDFNVDVSTKCPVCGVAYASPPLSSHFILTEDDLEFDARISSIYFCPHCEYCFLVNYLVERESCTGIFSSIYPTPEQTTDFPEQIKNLSPQFVKIYHESEQAESAGLTEICGMGYRKALEFLIKDYAIHQNPELVDEIKAQPLAKCINKYINIESIVTLAERSAWIGNDETHYVRKHNNLDFNDMKLFIAAAVHFMSMNLIVEKAESISRK